MIASGRILATHVSRLNDAMEYEIGVSFVTDFIRTNLQPASKAIIDKAISRLRSVDTFIACYTAAADVLSQWRAYSRTGTGYCIGLKTSEMAAIDGRMPLLEKVIYSKITAESVLSLLLARVEEFLGDHDFEKLRLVASWGRWRASSTSYPVSSSILPLKRRTNTGRSTSLPHQLSRWSQSTEWDYLV